MKKLNFILSLIMTIMVCAAHAQVKYFNGTLSEAVAKANENKKIVMVIASATWCGPCKHLTEEVFTTQEVGDFVNERMYVLKYYLDKEDPEGIATKYEIKAYPTLIFLDGQGKEINRATGGSEDGKSFIKKISKIANPENTEQSWLKRIAANPNETVNYLEYLWSLYQTQKADILLAEKLKEYPISITFSPAWIEYYRKWVFDPTSPVITLALERSDEIKKIMGAEEYDTFMSRKGMYFVSSRSTNKFYSREKLENIYKIVDANECLQSDFTNFVKANLDYLDSGNFEKIKKNGFRVMKKCDSNSRSRIMTVIAYVGVIKAKKLRTDPEIIECYDMAIKTEKDKERQASLIKSKEEWIEKYKNETKTGW